MSRRRSPATRRRAALAVGLLTSLACAGSLAAPRMGLAQADDPRAATPCPVLPEGTALVTGVVRDSAGGVALPGARVTFVWDPGPEAAAGQATSTTNREGVYVLCGIPTGTPVTTSSTFPHRRAEAIFTLPEGRRMVRIDFRLTGADPEDVAEEESRIAALDTAAEGEGSVVVGSVWDLSSQAPLVGAQISLAGTGRGTVTEAGGGFRLVDVPLGTHVLRVEHLGYTPAETTLDLDQPTRISIAARLSPRAIAMDAIEARGRAGAGLTEEERAAGGARYRVGREEFEKRPSASLAQVIRSKAPGVRFGRDSRGCPRFLTRNGPALIVVDGIPYRDGCILEEIDTFSIESVEVLSAVAGSIEWGSRAGGGVIEVTTRRE